MANEIDAGIRRVIFKEIKQGDLRKFDGSAADATTGQGAKDLRFGPFDVFDKVFRRMLPNVRSEMRKRGGGQRLTDVVYGPYSWKEPGKTGKVSTAEMVWETPQDKRPSEGRIARVHDYAPLRNPPLLTERPVLLLIQIADESVWPVFAKRASLESGKWNDRVAKHILRCLDEQRDGDAAARGFIDFDKNEVWGDV